MELNKEKAFEVVANKTGVPLDVIQENAQFFHTAVDVFLDIYDELDYWGAMDLLTQALFIQLGQEKEGTVADYFLTEHDDVFKTDFGYVYYPPKRQ